VDAIHNKQMKHILRALYHYTIEQIDLPVALDRAWREIAPDLRDRAESGDSGGGRLFVIAFGKAAVPMAGWFLDRAHGDEIRGVLSAPSVPSKRWRGLDCFAGGHPVPNPASRDAARRALELVRGATGDDLIVYLISGGGSSLFETPITEEISPVDLSALYGTLVRCGADLVQINTVRKHLSGVKGGRLAAAAPATRQLTLFASDVPPGQESSVASGPTMPDESTLDDFRRVVRSYELLREAPPSIVPFLNEASKLPETPKPGDTVFKTADWNCVLDNNDAIRAACRFAEGEGWSAVPDLSVDDVEVDTAAQQLIARLLTVRPSTPDGGPACIVSGGELSVKVRGDGVGGRNQAFVLETAERIAGKRIAVLSAGTDGIDGNSPAAGAVADGRTLERARSFGLNPAAFKKRSDSHTFFDTLGDAIECGPTQNNVRDIRVLVAW
jgi:hydroxypyruvate reductase